MSNVTSQSELTTKEIVEQAIQDYHNAILPYLAKGNNGYSETPIGAMQMFDDDTAPSGWLVADGTVYDIDDYPFLANHIERVHGSKNYYGGNGITTFAVPDWQGEFFRASGTNSHSNQGSGGAVGEHQDGTVFPNVFNNLYGTTKYIQINIGDTNAPSIDDVEITKDYAYDRSDFYQATANTGGSFIANKGPYTSRPTNTSLLCCIKAVPAGINYSLEEQEIGTWIDGKHLYQKTIYVADFSGNIWDVHSYGISNIDRVVTKINASIHYQYGGDDFWMNEFIHGNEKFIVATFDSGYRVDFHYDTSRVTDFYLTIQYTKTTD